MSVRPPLFVSPRILTYPSHIITVGVPEYHLSSLRHLLVKETADAAAANASTEQTIQAACAMVLSLSVEDVEENIPLSSYGLDSLTSVRLSGILKQYFDITATQLQLLSSHMTGKHPHHPSTTLPRF